MAKSTGTIIRAFDGSLADAEGLLAVERATFDESPYSAREVQVMLSEGLQRAWLALGGEGVVGFIVAFATHGLSGPSWEIDLLAVGPGWTGRGLATRLIRAAAAHGARVACRARAVVATDNIASARAFTRAGFRPGPGMCRLLIYRLQGPPPHPWSALGVTVRETANVAEAADWLPGDKSATQRDLQGLTLLLAEQNGQPAGYAELIEVQTLLYRGVWIESLAALTPIARAALIHQAVNWASAAGLGEIGTMVPEREHLLREYLLAAGFRSLGDFRWFAADLPLPGLAAASRSSSGAEENPGQDHV